MIDFNESPIKNDSDFTERAYRIENEEITYLTFNYL